MENTPELQEFILSIFAEQAKREKQQKLERYRRLNQYVIHGQILFAGSSLMEQFPINELTMDLKLPYTIYNRGVGGFTIAEMSDALDVCVYDLKPKHIFINIGTNDLNDAAYTHEEFICRYEELLQRIKHRLPQAQLHLLAYYPVNEPVGLADPYMRQIIMHRSNQRITEANHLVKNLAGKLGATYHDFNAGIADESGNQKTIFTIDGMHMYANGYRAVLEQMVPLLQTLI